MNYFVSQYVAEKINTACCSCCALQCFELCRLDIVADPAADSECTDGGEILPMMDFKAAEFSKKVGLCQSTLMLFYRVGKTNRNFKLYGFTITIQ